MTVGDETAIFDFGNQMPKDIHETLEIVYSSLEEKGYNPINQIVGYLADTGNYITRQSIALLRGCT